MPRNEKGQFLPGTHWREDQPFRHKEWLEREYVENKRSTGDIARQFQVTDASIIFWLRKHNIPRRSTSQARAVKKWGSFGEKNPMWNRRGKQNPNWNGGATPERQSFYVSQEWKAACSFVWKRDNATCQRCKVHRSENQEIAFHVHHIVSFSVRELRADPSNLVLLCEKCHRFVHSKRNVNGDFISKK